MKHLPLTEAQYKAVLEGAKTQIRIPVDPQPELHEEGCGCDCFEPRGFPHFVYEGWTSPIIPPPLLLGSGADYKKADTVALVLPYWQSPDEIPGGGRVTIWDAVSNLCRFRWPDGEVDWYEPSRLIPNSDEGWKLMPAPSMPDWACLHTVTVTDVRPEQLGDISAKDVEAEGVDVAAKLPAFPPPEVRSPEKLDELATFVARLLFKELWESTYGKDSWNSELWVWAYTFKLNKETQ